MKTRIVFFGSFDFAVPILERFSSLGNEYDIVAVVTNPDKPQGKNRTVTESPVKKLALKLGLRVLQPETIKTNSEFLTEIQNLNPELGILIGYGKILPKALLDSFKFGIINIHPSLLPLYRGTSPVQSALLNSELKTGVSIMRIDEEMDHGPILAQKEVLISKEDSYLSLTEKLFEEGSNLLMEVLPEYINERLIPKKQEHTMATFSKIIKTKDAEILSSDSVVKAIGKVRAFNPEPGAYILWPMNSGSLRIKIFKAEVADSENSAWPTFKVEDGYIKLLEIQPEGKRIMTGEEWFRGLKT